MKRIYLQIKDFLAAQASKERDTRDYARLISLSNKAIRALLSSETIKKAERNILFKLVHFLQESKQAGSLIPKMKEYCEKNEYNTPDYKISRELILKFPGKNDFAFLRDAAHAYYFDGLLVTQAIEQMIAINPIDGLIAGIESAQSFLDKSKKVLQKDYFGRLKEYANDGDLTFEKIRYLASGSLYPFSLRKGAAKIILQRNMIEGVEKDDHDRLKEFYEKIATSRSKKDYKRKGDA